MQTKQLFSPSSELLTFNFIVSSFALPLILLRRRRTPLLVYGLNKLNPSFNRNDNKNVLLFCFSIILMVASVYGALNQVEDISHVQLGVGHH